MLLVDSNVTLFSYPRLVANAKLVYRWNIVVIGDGEGFFAANGYRPGDVFGGRRVTLSLHRGKG